MRRGSEIGQSENALAGLDAVHAGHLPVDKGDLVAFASVHRLAHHTDRLFARGRLVGDEGHVGQHARQHGTRMRVVVDDEDAPAAQIGLQETRSRDRGPLTEARGEAERAALARFALDGDLASHQLGELLGDRQSESRTAVFAGGRGVGLLEGLEQTLDLRLAHADAGIAHGELDELAVGSVLQNPNLDCDLAFVGELDGVVAEIDQDLTEPERIAPEMGRDRGLNLEDQLKPLGRGLLAHQVADILKHLVEIEVDVFDRQFAGLDLREIENVVDDAEQVLAGALDLLDVIALARGEVGLQGEV